MVCAPPPHTHYTIKLLGVGVVWEGGGVCDHVTVASFPHAGEVAQIKNHLWPPLIKQTFGNLRPMTTAIW